jgi:hypothetical protein
MMLDAQFPLALSAAKHGYHRFIDACRQPGGEFALTPRADVSAYALCFAIFGLQLLRDRETLERHRAEWDGRLRHELRRMREERRAVARLQADKTYLQLLTFVLSALSILDTLRHDPLAELVTEVLRSDVAAALREARALEGVARSGNQAMFIGILLLHARDYLDLPFQAPLDEWVWLHLSAINRQGFWGPAVSMSHLQFQNGYHQYELLEYLHVEAAPWQRAAASVASLADGDGHFAPYPGGGGCYDYDAVFLLTTSADVARPHASLLARTATTLLAEQNPDGGFAESLRVRPRSLDNLARSARHVLAGHGLARRERLRQAVTLLRPRHDCIETHWSRYSRGWSESDLWDSWFRMLALARIECIFDPTASARWGFINYPGIGYHPSLRAGVPA